MKIRIGPSTIHKRGRSLFLYFNPADDDEALLLGDALHTLPQYREVGPNVCEIPLRLFENVLIAFDEWDIEIYGDVPKNIVTYIESRNRIIENSDSSEFQFKTEPFEHQLECFNYAKEHECFLLGDEQGLGKTKQAIDIAVSRKTQFKHCLIVCCVSGLKWNWAQEVETHSFERAHILGARVARNGNLVIDGVAKRTDDLISEHDEFFLITNIETLRDKNFGSALEELTASGDIGMVVVDEVHKCKNPTSQQGKALHKLKSYYKMALTGTPIMNTPIDTYNVMKWLGVEHHNFTAFKERYCIMDIGGQVTGYRNLSELRELLADHMLRRLKADVLDLPDKIRVTDYVDMSQSQNKIYNEVRTKLLEDIDKILISSNPLAETVRLRQATGCPELLTTKNVKSVKFERAVELIEEDIESGVSVVVFSNWREVIQFLKKRLGIRFKGIRIEEVTGETKDKFSAIERFMEEDGPAIIVGTIGALGTGFTLTKASHVIFLDSPWTRSDKDQAEDRTHRIGATQNVTITTIVAKGTIDERIEQLVARKGELADYVVDGESLVSPVGKLFDILLN